MSRAKVDICPKGHDKRIVGVQKTNRACMECHRQRSAANKTRPQYKINYANQNWKNHGIKNESGDQFTYSDFNRMFQIQGGKCAFPGCGRHQSEVKEALNVDHNHETGKARALLCNRCNKGVVSAHSIKSAMNLLDYLRKHDGD